VEIKAKLDSACASAAKFPILYKGKPDKAFRQMSATQRLRLILLAAHAGFIFG